VRSTPLSDKILAEFLFKDGLNNSSPVLGS